MCRPPLATALLTCATLAASIGISRAAAAEGEPEPPVTPFLDSGNTLPDLGARERAARPQLGKWYGWQILLADAATLTCAATTRQPLCMVPFPFAGPLIHAANERRWVGITSVVLRLAIPMAGAGVGKGFAHCPDRSKDWGFIPTCGLEYSAWGALAGAAVASVIDAAIGFTHVAPATEPDAPIRQARRVSPRLAVGPDGFSLGLGAAF